jgi:sulfatase maturation enzyme AslB (radical SAM superfamily)
MTLNIRKRRVRRMTLAPDMAPGSGVTGTAAAPGKLTDLFQLGLDAPICLTWELTYACNLSCVHCLSSSGRRDPRELSTAECKTVIDTLERMQVFYVNIGGGEPTVRPDFWELVDYATAHHVGVKFSTNGVRLDAAAAARLAASDYVDVQISLDGATREVNDAVRGPGRTSRRSINSRRSPTSSARSCGSPGCGRRGAARTCGTSCTRSRRSRRSCTTGWWRTASRC